MSENQAKNQVQPVFLGELIQSNDTAQIEAVFEELPPVEVARRISSLNKADPIHLLELLRPEKFAGIISKMSGLGAANMVALLTSEQAAPIVNELPRQLQVNILRRMKKSSVSEILHAIKPHKAEKIERLMRYRENTASGLMITEYLSYPEDMLVKEVGKYQRKSKKEDLQEPNEEMMGFNNFKGAYKLSA